MTNLDANDLLMGSSTPAAKFDSIGVLVRGTIVKTGVSQQRDFATKEPLYWNAGRPSTTVTAEPMMQAVITVQVDDRDGPDDNGHRSIYCGSRNMREAVREAVTNTGAKTIEVGGTLAVQYTGGSGNTGDPKQYKAEYKPPAIGVGLLTGEPQAGGPQPTPSTSLLG